MPSSLFFWPLHSSGRSRNRALSLLGPTSHPALPDCVLGVSTEVPGAAACGPHQLPGSLAFRPTNAAGKGSHPGRRALGDVAGGGETEVPG